MACDRVDTEVYLLMKYKKIRYCHDQETNDIVSQAFVVAFELSVRGWGLHEVEHGKMRPRWVIDQRVKK
jgi:hypothetical protein